MKSAKTLEIKLLGELSLVRGGRAAALPPSRKTRALLAYLAARGGPHPRERLCRLLWDVTDDPRGALRWSLSRLRPLVDEPGTPRLRADRTAVSLDLRGVEVDLLVARERARSVDALSLDAARDLAARFRGEFLEGLELPDFHEFQAWCAAEREDARRLHAALLRRVIAGTRDDAAAALPHARRLLEVEPESDTARAELARLLIRAGRPREARLEIETGRRLRAERGDGRSEALDAAERDLAAHPAGTEPDAARPAAPDRESAPPPGRPLPFVGREAECRRLAALLEETARERRETVLLLHGEPGVGKSRLLGELARVARERGGTVLEGRVYEAEARRPYGPWIEAMSALRPVTVGDVLGKALAPLFPSAAPPSEGEASRDRLFAGVVDLLAARAAAAPPVLLALDDVQWCDEASIELLHYAARMSRSRPVLIALAARAGELPDNVPMQRVLRGFRREGNLREIDLEPLGRPEIAALVAAVGGTADPDRVYAESAGNPLFALELAQSAPGPGDALAPTLSELVRDRVDRLPETAGDILRWSAILGASFPVTRLQDLLPPDLGDPSPHLALLERHRLLRAAPAPGAYAFAHGLVRRAVLDDLSGPRRRLMHRKVAALLHASPGLAAAAEEIVHHAALAGESALAARAAVEAGRRCLALFANAEAWAFARDGLHHATALPEPERVRLEIDLTEVSLTARRPGDPEGAARALESLAERALRVDALESARLAFHLLSILRWEKGDWKAARAQTLRAEEIARAADPREQVVAMAEAARCLCLLERDLPRAEALVLEARARAGGAGVETAALHDALGLLRLHQGKTAEAADLFWKARDRAVRDGDRLAEFQALEHLILLELERDGVATAAALAGELVELGNKLREGSEAPFARALAALLARARGDGAGSELEEALRDLRDADAKHRLAYALIVAAEQDLARGAVAPAEARAGEALRMAEALGRPSERAMAHVVLGQIARERGDDAALDRHRSALGDGHMNGVSARARRARERLVGADS